MAETKIRASQQIEFDDNIDINNKKLINVATPTNPADVANKAYVDNLLGNADAFVYKGVIDCSTNPNYPAADCGHSYKVSVGGKIGGASGKAVGVGDLLICTVDGTAAGTQATVGDNWNVIPANASTGAVTSNSTSVTDNAIVRMDGGTGAVIQTSNATIDDNGSINIPAGQKFKIGGSNLAPADIGAEPALTKGNITENGSSVLTITGGTNAVVGGGVTIQVKTANGSQAGVLSAADWSTFNGKLGAASRVIREVPTGLMNGSNTVFTLGNTPISGTEEVFKRGLLMNAGAGNDYTISGNTITFARAPISTDVILVNYWK